MKQNELMMEIHFFKLNCISGHVISVSAGSGASGAEGQSNSVDGTHMQPHRYLVIFTTQT